MPQSLRVTTVSTYTYHLVPRDCSIGNNYPRFLRTESSRGKHTYPREPCHNVFAAMYKDLGPGTLTIQLLFSPGGRSLELVRSNRTIFVAYHHHVRQIPVDFGLSGYIVPSAVGQLSTKAPLCEWRLDEGTSKMKTTGTHHSDGSHTPATTVNL